MESYQKRTAFRINIWTTNIGNYLMAKFERQAIMTNMLNKLLILQMRKVRKTHNKQNMDYVYQHYNKLFIAGTRDFPQDHIDDSTLPFDDTLNKTKRGRGADMYYRSHHEIYIVIGHSLGGSVALALGRQYNNKMTTHMG